ncbi:M48 family metallopeptidase [Chthonobacter albigriseus]|uniref:M48 family metallopeptidase n=1 Tax=Chthonobacter albigriseus TaxID=1683161 RepID=UPI0015EEF7D5|nr:M48 family metallopeptidase [Chthonobacter albigriseus]
MWIEGRAVYKQGTVSQPRSVTIAIDVRGLAIRTLTGEDLAQWPFRSLVKSTSGPLVIRHRDGTDRVEIQDPRTRAAFEAVLKAIPSADESPGRSLAVSAMMVIAFLAALTAGAVWSIRSLAESLAPMVPAEIVEVIDASSVEMVLDVLGSSPALRCDSVDGAIAINRLADRLTIAGRARTMSLDIQVYKGTVANAVALPGGTIIVTDALLKRVRIPDAFAGVLAHEIGHVHHRHGMTALLREGGLILALTLVTGDASSIATGTVRLLVGAAYSREAESEADAFAVEALAGAGGDPKALGPFLVDLASDEPEPGGLLSLLASHPLSADRRRAIETLAAESPMAEGSLILDEDWADIRTMCD